MRGERSRSVVGLFAGIGGFELAARKCGVESHSLCEIDPAASAVLAERFPKVPLTSDVADIKSLPRHTWAVTAGFPCQDLSSSGAKTGIGGKRSSLVEHVFRLLDKSDPDWVILENVMFMLHLDRGAAMDLVISSLERLGFNWSYRLLDTADFGLPQRRRRVYFVASRKHCALSALRELPIASTDEVPAVRAGMSVGFYWTEGTYATGLAANAIPPLKAGSTIGIPSPPAVLLPDGQVGTPSIEDAERLQGFPARWTKAAGELQRESIRWRLVGNAVSVPVAESVIRGAIAAESMPSKLDSDPSFAPLSPGTTWPAAAFGAGGSRFRITASVAERTRRARPLHSFLLHEVKPLSAKAARGFLSRAAKGGLRFPEGFLQRVERHAIKMEKAHANTK